MVPQFKIHLKFVMEQIAKVVYQLIDFEEGESYKIYVKVILDKSGFLKKYILPSFYFCDKANDNFSFSLRFNILTIFLLLLFIF